MITIDSWAELDFDRSPFLKYTEIVNTIIKPLSNHFGLDCFTFHKTFADDSQIRLCNNSKWYKHYLSKKLYLESIFELSADKYQSSYFIWSTVTSHKNIVSEANKFGIYQGVTIINRVGNDCEFYFLGTSNYSQARYRSLILNISQITKFVPYFNRRANEIIQKLNADKVYSKDMKLNVSNSDTLYDFNKDSFILDLCDIELTSREKDVALLLIKNKTAKEIALSLYLSYRTIEQYIDQLKEKFKSNSKRELESSLMKLFL